MLAAEDPSPFTRRGEGSVRETLLLAQYRFAEEYSAQLRASIQGGIMWLLSLLLVTVPLQVVGLPQVTGVPAGLTGPVVLVLSGAIAVVNLLITVYVFNSLVNDVNALRIERALGCADVGLWHNWYGLTRAAKAPPPGLACRYYGLGRGTSFVLVSAWFTLAASVVLAFVVHRATGGGPASVALAAAACALNLLAQAAVMRLALRSASPEFAALFRDLGFTAR